MTNHRSITTNGEIIDFLKQFDQDSELLFHSLNDEAYFPKITPEIFNFEVTDGELVIYGYIR